MTTLPNTLNYTANLARENNGYINADHLNKSERRSLILNLLDDILDDSDSVASGRDVWLFILLSRVLPKMAQTYSPLLHLLIPVSASSFFITPSFDKTDIELSELVVADYSLVVLLLKFIAKPTDTIAAHRLSDDLVDRIFAALPHTISEIFDEAQDEYLSKYECENIEHIRADNLERYRDFKDRAVNY